MEPLAAAHFVALLARADVTQAAFGQAGRDDAAAGQRLGPRPRYGAALGEGRRGSVGVADGRPTGGGLLAIVPRDHSPAALAIMIEEAGAAP